MHPLIQQNKSAIVDLCRHYRVKRLEVFGSAARAVDFDLEYSDADFLVEFAEDGQRSSLQVFFALQQELEQLIGRHVDLAETAALQNPYLLASIEQSRELVYAA
ncbi:nucleotidyltransferase domain-containing protein [Methylomonas sp. SURF-2]|uniref:Nucleotidyltransferase domain-containing protein n=1 Tax=Methylomonas subterranea TaxID=2952225 RepID=A0ABT1TGA3_9GAMM|nr:nucleotidyltransferase domain-containing protein [Methylomonas sp. SURF-2]MCQ8103789.1 nucleotidyltransferase domain-containing protein [Methylomonas sp. SURF-2]